MTCPDCGVEMNHHANKIDQTDVPDKPQGAGPGQIIEEAHTCPECGKTVVRRRPLDAAAPRRKLVPCSTLAHHGRL